MAAVESRPHRLARPRAGRGRELRQLLRLRSIGPVADLLQRQRGFSDTEIGWLNAIYSLPNVVLLLFGGWMVDRNGAAA